MVVNCLKPIIPNLESIRISSNKICEADIGLNRYISLNALEMEYSKYLIIL